MRIFKVMAIAFMLLFVGVVAAQAVEVAGESGKGQALIYPYYNITQPLGMNHLRIVNTSSTQGVGVKVRLRQAENSNEVMDFYVCLSAKDEWSGWILPVVAGGSVVGGVIENADNPNDPVTPTYPDIRGRIPFQFPATYEPANPDKLDANLEGYIEVISAVAWTDVPGQRAVGTPEACKERMEIGGFSYPRNVLIGDMHLINADRAADSVFAYNATALKDFNDTQIEGVTLENDSPPRLLDADGGIQAVEAALAKTTAHIMHTNVFRDNGKASPDPAGTDIVYTGQTDFIVLFPTKKDLFAGESVHFKAQKWDNAEHSEFVWPFPSPVIVPPRPFNRELNYVMVANDMKDVVTANETIFQTTCKNKYKVYWGNLELKLFDQVLYDYIQDNYVNTGIITQDDLDSLAPAYEQGYVDVTFLSGAYDSLGIRPIPPAQPRGAIVLKLEKIEENASIPRSWTHALEAQYEIP